MLVAKSRDIPYSEVTPKSSYLNRRKLLFSFPAAFLLARARAAIGLGNLVKSPLSANEKVNSFKDVTTYNNFYEFGTSKEQPAQLAKNFKTDPWMVSVEGEVAKPRKFSMEEILKLAPLEERIYRHRCVEGWSIVVPWVGYSLSMLLKMVEPTSKAKLLRSRPITISSRCRRLSTLASRCRTWRDFAWMKPCTRWRYCAWACMANRYRRRMARP